jgi:hypothetical protein
MGVHHDARISHSKKIDKLKNEVARLEGLKAKEATAEADLDADISKLADRAAGGDRAALSQQRELRKSRDNCRIQIENLEALAPRKALAQAETDLPRLELMEACEASAEEIAQLPALAKKLSEIVAPVAQQFSDFRLRFDAIVATALRLVGDPDRVRNLAARADTAVLRGLQAQLARDFESHNLSVLEKSDGDFQGVVEGVLRSTIDALQVILYTSGNAAVPGRATFRCTTNIGGLMSMHLRDGEVVSLPVENPDVQKMIAAGALVPVDAQKLLTSEARA